MTRVLAMLLAVVPALTAVVGCATRAPASSAASPTQSSSGRAAAVAAPDPATVARAISARAFEITDTGKFPVWQWAEVIQGRGFLLEIRIPNQSANPDPGAALATIAANAYRRAAAVLATPGG